MRALDARASSSHRQKRSYLEEEEEEEEAKKESEVRLKGVRIEGPEGSAPSKIQSIRVFVVSSVGRKRKQQERRETFCRILETLPAGPGADEGGEGGRGGATVAAKYAVPQGTERRQKGGSSRRRKRGGKGVRASKAERRADARKERGGTQGWLDGAGAFGS